MASLGSILIPYRAFHIGYPGSGKTGALAALANLGYKLRILDYDGNIQPLQGYVDPRVLADRQRVDVVTLQDKMKNNDKYVAVDGMPVAFNRGLELMKEWKYKDENGEEVSLGKSADWGMETIVVIDTLTTMGAMAKNRAMVMNNKTPSNMTSAVWGAAVADVNNMINIMKTGRFHLIINTHKQTLGPADFIQQGDAEEVKEKKLEMIGDGMIPPRIYPVGVTKPSSQTIHGALPIMLEFSKTTKLGKEVRIIDTVGSSLIDVKMPGRGLKKEYPIETGLADIFEAMGYKAPGF